MVRRSVKKLVLGLPTRGRERRARRTPGVVASQTANTRRGGAGSEAARKR